MQEKWDEALDANRSAAEHPEQRGKALFSIVCAHARLGRKDDAFRALGLSIEAGHRKRRAYESDSDLDSIRSDAKFAELLAKRPK